MLLKSVIKNVNVILNFIFLNNVLLQIVQMAHALRRISYATCDPENCLFSFIARQPKGHFKTQYCHCFLTISSIQVS